MLKNKKMITMISALCALATIGGVSAVKADAAATTLEGFTCAGASVNAEEVGVRFELKLEGAAVSKSSLDAGVVYMPYDLYTGDVNDLTKETANVATAEFGWEAIQATQEEDYVGVAELPASAIPQNQYNRILLVRGYIVDGENVYYTAPVKTSMAYSAWKGAEALPQYAEALKAYMGPYTLTSDAGNVENLYYGDTVAGLPTQKDGKNIVKWFWDAEKTNEIKSTDYATGSMNVYYEVEKFAVTGTVSGASNLESVKVYANGKEVGTVAANGEYTVWLEAGEYELTFANEDYIAYADVEVAAAVTKDIALVSNTWLGSATYGKINATVPTYTKGDELDGSFTATGATYDLFFPNTETTNAFSYSATISGISGGGDPTPGVARQNMGPGLNITNGTWRLSVSCYQWGQFVVSLSSVTGYAYNTIYYTGTGTTGSFTMQVVRTANKIDWYINNTPMLTFEKGKLTAHVEHLTSWGDSLTGNLANMNGFFGEDVELAVGITGMKAHDGGLPTCEATYALSMQEFATVTGKVSAPEGSTLDLTATTLKIGSAAYDLTIDAQGNFTAYVPEGTQTLEFANGAWGATAADQVITLNATNTVNVELADYKWAPGTFGSRISNMTYDAADALDGNFTVSNAVNKGVIFPNLATTGNFTYAVSFSNVARADDDGAYGILMTDGNWTFQVALKRWEPVLTNFCTGYGYAINDQWNPTADSGYTGGTLKFIRTSEKIEVYYNANLYFTLTKDTFTANGFDLLWDGSLDCPNQWKSIGANFFDSTKPITVGLVTLGNCTGFTANCSFTNN